MTSDDGTTADQPQVIGRRELLANLSLGGAVLILGAGVVNAFIRFIVPPAKGIGGAGEEVEVGTASDIAVGHGKKFFSEGVTYWVLRVDDGFKAFNAKCTHAGCIVDWDSGARYFKCPCHGAAFDANGNVISGPAPNPLASVATLVKGDKVYLRG